MTAAHALIQANFISRASTHSRIIWKAVRSQGKPVYAVLYVPLSCSTESSEPL